MVATVETNALRQRTCWVMAQGDRVVRLAMAPRGPEGFALFIYDSASPAGRYEDTTVYRSTEAVRQAAADLQTFLCALGWQKLPLA